MKLKQYDKNQKHSYCLGAYPTIELFKYRPKAVIEVFINPKGQNNRGVKELEKIARQNNVRVENGNKVLQRFSGKENVYAGARFSKYECSLEKDSPHIVMDKPENLGNLGTVVRSMHAFGYKNLAIIRPSADIFNPKVIRSSMGSVFAVNFEFFNSLGEYKQKYEKNLYILTPKADTSLEELRENVEINKSAFVFGSESSGFSGKELGLGKNIRIDFSKDVDSLNVSIAAGIIMHRFKTI